MTENSEITPENVILPVSKEFNPKSITDEIEAEVQEELKSESTETSEEKKELTEEEQRELFIRELKASHMKFKPTKHPIKNGMLVTNVTVNRFGTAYKKERKRKNKQTKASRRANRK